MKSIKALLWALLLIFLVAGVVQNLSVLTHRESVRLNLLVREYQTEPIQLFLYFLSFFLIGLLISYFYGVAERFKANKTIKGHVETISKLEEELKVYRSLSIQKENTPSKETKKV
jgi:uncharacterized integral membrane protein